jgi:hypothetical protein
MPHPSSSLPFPHNPNRRSFLRALAVLGLTAKTPKPDKHHETVFRFLTPECEVRMSVQYFGSLSTNNLRFRDQLSNRSFCLSPNGEENQSCLEKFSGSMAIARYHFRSRLQPQAPLIVRERVLTIDHDSRMNPRPPFERVLAIQKDVASDIQAFGYSPGNLDPPLPGARPLILWCLLRQDLYLNDQSSAFLIVHWKHTLDLISLVDVIPGDQTQIISS